MQQVSRMTRKWKHRLWPLARQAAFPVVALCLIGVWQLSSPQLTQIRSQPASQVLHIPTRAPLSSPGAGRSSDITASKPHKRCRADACVDIDISDVKRGSDVMYGLAWEDINHSGEGGLHVEMLRDWSFEARAYLEQHSELTQDDIKTINVQPWPMDAPDMKRPSFGLAAESMDPSGVAAAPLRDLEAWQLAGGSAKGSIKVIDEQAGLHALCITSASATVTWLTNKGHTLQGFAVVSEETYRLRLRVMGKDEPIIFANFGDSDGNSMHAEATLKRDDVLTSKEEDKQWSVWEATLKPSRSESATFLHLTWRGARSFCLDYVSLTPKSAWSAGGEGYDLNPFSKRLVAALSILRPQFIRFPGGAFVEGTTLQTTYKWSRTVGPREKRSGHPNVNWGYWSSDALGLYEYLQLCELLKAKPVWVVQSGISQTASATPSDLTPWIQDALDALQFIRGSEDSKWGRVRADMGHAAPWQLEYVTIGNEECRRPWYLQHYQRIARALLDVYPDVKLISNCDLTERGLEAWVLPWAWEFHSYKAPEEIFALSKLVHMHNAPIPVAVTEFAALGPDPVRNAVAEAGFMAALERDCSKAALVAYAPVLGREGLKTWSTTLLTFNSSRHWTPSPSFTIQQIFRNTWKGWCAKVAVHSGVSTPELVVQGVEASVQCAGAGCTSLTIKLVNFRNESSKVELAVSGGKKTLTLDRKSMFDSKETVYAELLRFDPSNLVPSRMKSNVSTSDSQSVAAILAEDDLLHEGNALGTSSGFNAALQSMTTINLHGASEKYTLPPYSLTIITAETTATPTEDVDGVA